MSESSRARQSAQHEIPITVAMAVLTVTAGAVDAISFLGLGQGFVAVGAAGFGATSVPHLLVITIVALAMGIRSMAALRAAIPGMPTQMIQGSLVAVIDAAVSRRRSAGRSLPAGTKLSLTRHAATIGGTLVGAVLGALLVNAGVGVALLVVAAVVLVIAGVYALVPRYRPPTPPMPAPSD